MGNYCFFIDVFKALDQVLLHLHIFCRHFCLSAIDNLFPFETDNSSLQVLIHNMASNIDSKTTNHAINLLNQLLSEKVCHQLWRDIILHNRLVSCWQIPVFVQQNINIPSYIHRSFQTLHFLFSYQFVKSSYITTSLDGFRIQTTSEKAFLDNFRCL